MWCQCLSVYEHGLLTGGDAGGVPGSSGNGQRHVGDACSWSHVCGPPGPLNQQTLPTPAPLFSELFDDSVRLAGRRFALHYSNAGRSRVQRITMALFKVVVYHVSLTVRRHRWRRAVCTSIGLARRSAKESLAALRRQSADFWLTQDGGPPQRPMTSYPPAQPRHGDDAGRQFAAERPCLCASAARHRAGETPPCTLWSSRLPAMLGAAGSGPGESEGADWGTRPRI
jgi:hypothetical protein